MTTIRIDDLTITNGQQGFNITTTNIWNPPMHEVNDQELMETDGAISTFQRFKSRKIEINGQIKGESVDDWTLKLNRLNRKVNKRSVQIRISEGGVPEKFYESIITKLTINRATMPDFATFKLVAWCGSPFALGEAVTSPDFQIATPAGSLNQVDTVFYTNSLQQEGTADICPVITFTVTRFEQSVPLTSVDTHLEVGNPNNGRFMKFTFNPNSTFVLPIQSLDTFRIDCPNKNVTQNGNIVYAEGVFPTWSPEATQNTIRFSSNTDATWGIIFNVRFHHRYL